MSRLRELVNTWNRAEERRGVPPEHRSFFLSADSGHSPVLALHGAGGSPADYSALARYLVGLGRSILCPLMPGHGLDAKALGEVRFAALIATARAAYDAAADGKRIPVIGQSLGAVVAVRLAAQVDPACFVALAPALRPRVLVRVLVLAPLFLVRPALARATSRWYRELRRGIKDTIPEIERVTCPLCVLHSRGDRSVHLAGAHLLHDRASSAHKRLVILRGQGHTLANAPDRESVYTPIAEFLDGIA